MSAVVTDLPAEALRPIAEVVHEAIRMVQHHTGEEVAPTWPDAPDWMKESTLAGIRGVLDGNGPEESHEQWMQARLEAGWTLGPVKDIAAKTSPNLVPYAELPEEQKLKDGLFVMITTVMSQQVLRFLNNEAQP